MPPTEMNTSERPASTKMFIKPELDPRSKLPVEDPAYLYPPSRNPYYEKIAQILPTLGYVDAQSETNAGKWRGLIPDAAAHPKSRSLHVEVGCNAGHVVLEWAKRNPDCAYVGVDWKIKPIFWAVEKAIKRKIPNILFIRAHAGRLQHIFGDGEVDSFSIFFPDPWPTKSQWKNRWVTAERLRRIAQLLRSGGQIEIKTDHPGYFDWMLEAVLQVQDLYSTVEMTRDLHAGHPSPGKLEIPDVTLFERLFIRDGIPIQRLVLKKRS